MLITTSRKPSARTRSFSQSLNRVLKSRYINRGKMSIRDVFIKSSNRNEKTAIISEKKGNPSRIDVYDEKNENILSLDITVALSKKSADVNKKQLSLRCEIDDLRERLMDVFDVPENKNKSNLNCIWVKRGQKEKRAVIEFYDKNGLQTGPKIYLNDWRL